MQVPYLAERLCTVQGHRALVKIGPGGRAGGMRSADSAPYQEAWSQPGALRGMLSWYRAMVPALLRALPSTRIAAPTLVLWGENDPCLSRSMAQHSVDLCDRGQLVYFERATHWPHWDEPERVNQLVIDWLEARSSKLELS
jgi:pimeloyl-ACP methyl ester carboxylesterase